MDKTSPEYNEMIIELLELLEKYNVSTVTAVIEGDEEHGHVALTVDLNIFPTLEEAFAAVKTDIDEEGAPHGTTIQ